MHTSPGPSPLDDNTLETSPSDHADRPFGLAMGLYVVVASMVGIGILTTSGYMLRDLRDPWILLAVWALGGLLALAGGLTLAELATVFPKVGGDYVYVREAFGNRIAFLYGWAMQLFGFAAPTAVVSLALFDYLFQPLVTRWGWIELLGPQSLAVRLLAGLLIVILTVLHCLGTRESSWTQGITTVCKLAIIVLAAAVALTLGRGDWGHFHQGVGWQRETMPAMAISLVYVMYAYSGWNAAVFLAGEIRHPARLLPLATLGGCGLVVVLYLLLNVVYVFAINPGTAGELQDHEVLLVAALAAERLFGPNVSTVLSLAIALGLLATISSFVLTGPRILVAMARDGLLPAAIGKRHAVTGMPVLATVVQSGMALLMLLAAGEGLSRLIALSGLGIMLLAGMVNASIFVLRRRPGYSPIYRVPAYPLPQCAFLATIAWIVFWFAWSEPLSLMVAFVFFAIGFPLAWVVDRFRPTSGDATNEIK